MKELKKINLETMRERMQVLSPEEERIIAGGATIDDCISALRNSGYDVNVYSDPNEVPEDIWNTGKSFSFSISFSSSSSCPGSGTFDNPFQLPEYIVSAPHLEGQLMNSYYFNSISEYVKQTFNTAWYDSMAKVAISRVPGIGDATSVLSDRLQNVHANGLAGLLDTGCPNNQEIYVSVRHRSDQIFPENEVRIYNSQTGDLIYTTGWQK